MRNFTLFKCTGLYVRKVSNGFSKRTVILLVMMIMMTGNALAGVSYGVIDGFKYLLNSDSKTASLVANAEKYTGDIVIPENIKAKDGNTYSVTSFEDNSFWGCSGLTSVSIPSSVTSLGNYCFKDCSNLASINVPSSVTKMGQECFYNCSRLASVTISSAVTSLGDGCFYNCTSLASITIPSSVTSLGERCFWYCSKLTSIIIPSSVTSIGQECFYNCSGLTSVILPSAIKSLEYQCFSGCSSLASVKIPSSVTSLGQFCFSGCSSLTSVTIPSSVISIGMSCFSKCSSLPSVTIPSSVTSLGAFCFEHCSRLETMYFKGSTPRNLSDASISTTCIFNVPSEYLEDYKKTLGSYYKYIYAWNPSESGDDTKPVTQCATPSISYASGELKFASETAGAEYHYTITDADMASNAYNKEGKVTLSAAYKISVYATADGYTASDKAEATLYWINANLDNGTNINQVRTRGVVASAHDGIISLSGLDDGEVVKFFAADGKYLGSTVAANGAASYAVSESLVIAKVGKDSIKIAMK